MESFLKPTQQKTLLVVTLILVGIMVLALAAALLSDFSKLQEVFRHLKWGYFGLSLLLSGLSYLASALSFNTLFRMTPYRVPFPKFFSIMFISDTVNFIISSAGMSSIANRALLLKQEKVPYSVSIPLSLAQNMIFNLALSCVVIGGLFYLRGHPEFKEGPKQAALLVFMAGLFLVMAGMVLIFLNRAIRRGCLGLLFRAGEGIKFFLRRKKIHGRPWVKNLDQVDATIGLLKKGWPRLLLVFFFVGLIWCGMALTFYFCFQAVGLSLPLGLLVVGFAVMFLSSNINPVPAGLGVSESLLAFTFKALGVDFNSTLVAAILYRLVYYMIPLAISTALYLDRMRTILGNKGK
jgi:uncharacterized protein (TIRG00374 family)